MHSIASSWDFKSGANPPSSPTLVEIIFNREEPSSMREKLQLGAKIFRKRFFK